MQENATKIFACLVALAVVAVVIYAFFLIGSPARQRLRVQTEQKIYAPVAAPALPIFSCHLMQDGTDGSIHCVICDGNGVCQNTPAAWHAYNNVLKTGQVKIPYGCSLSSSGCELVQ